MGLWPRKGQTAVGKKPPKKGLPCERYVASESPEVKEESGPIGSNFNKMGRPEFNPSDPPSWSWSLKVAGHLRHVATSPSESIHFSGVSDLKKSSNILKAIDDDRDFVESRLKALEQEEFRDDSIAEIALLRLFEPMKPETWRTFINTEGAVEANAEMKLLRQKTGELSRARATQKRNSLMVNNIALQPSLPEFLDTAQQTVSFNGRQLTLLQSFFRGYVSRVELIASDLMERGTWFRFLIDCNLLDPSKVVYSRATKVFQMYAEKHSARYKLRFQQWCLSIQEILKHGANGEERSQVEIQMLLFHDLLKLCEQRVELRAAKTKKSHRRQSVLRQNTETVGYNKLCAADPQWRKNLAEDELCEPEVQQLLQELKPPLYKLFKHFAGLTGSSGAGHSPARILSPAKIVDTLSTQCKGTEQFEDGMNRRGPLMLLDDRLDRAGFEAALQSLRIFPELVSWHQSRSTFYEIVDKGGPDAIGFTGFVEGLCRVFFQYLGGQGNTVQKEASGKWKCLWMLSWLRHQYSSLGLGSTEDWDQRRRVNLDEYPCKDLILSELLLWAWLRRKGHVEACKIPSSKAPFQANEVGARPVSAGSLRLLNGIKGTLPDHSSNTGSAEEQKQSKTARRSSTGLWPVGADGMQLEAGKRPSVLQVVQCVERDV